MIKSLQLLVSRSIVAALCAMMLSCAPATVPPPPGQAMAAENPLPEKQMKGMASEGSEVMTAPRQETIEGIQLPVRYQKPAYTLQGSSEKPSMNMEEDTVTIEVGADISTTTGSVPLLDILKRIASLKDMNVSWASDVDQYALVDVDIRAEDDFFKAIDNILRQRDYFHEVQGNTIIVKYKETRRFHIAMPFMSTEYELGVGGDVLGNAGAIDDDAIKGNMKAFSEGNKFDIWENIRTNLDRVLDIWETVPTDEDTAKEVKPITTEETKEVQGEASKETKQVGRTVTTRSTGKGFYTIDKPIGLITVTAPRPLMEKVADYLNTLKRELYRQIAIEAKIIEVVMENESSVGIDWSALLKDSNFDFNITFGNIDVHNPLGDSRNFSLGSKGFSLMIDALKTQGQTKVLSNPKISVMNGQPAIIDVGEDETYISKVTSTVSETGVVTYSVSTSSVFSGIGLGIVATIVDNDEVILNLTPVTSQLQEIQYESFGGSNGSRVGLPQVKLRELNTTVKVKNGTMLVVGGLIDTVGGNSEKKVPLLGDLPLISRLFKSENRSDMNKELIILLQPKIIN